ncbi:MAG: sigma-54-dependent transcriptional regulator [Planctomycetota bacterium]|jgi:DNA-binding NtrC family response regulator
MTASSSNGSILVVDDALETIEVLKRHLTTEGHRVYTAPGVEEALSILESTAVDLVITDLKMPRVSGLDLVKHVRDNHRDTEIMMITGYATVEGAVAAMKAGAEEYLPKPFTREELLGTVWRLLNKRRMRRQARTSEKAGLAATYGMIGSSAAMRQVFDAIDRAAGTSATVLISGESGTGKECVARAIHYNGARASAPFVPVNCGGIPEGLLESELFGHVKGAFTNATESRAGFFQTADRGSILLDEVSETSLAMQVKLLRVLQNKEIVMVGASRGQEVDVRILAATNKDLLTLVEKDSFRQDLYFRLNVIHIAIPPLRDRQEDIPSLITHFAEKYALEHGRQPLRFSEDALGALCNYYWPGNVREVENIVQRIVVMSDRDVVDVPDLPALMRFSAMRGARLRRTLQEVEIEHVQNVLESVGGNKTKAAEILGIDRKTLREKLKLATRPSC